MTERHFLKLTPHNRALAIKGVKAAKDGWLLELREPSRSAEQNAAIHGLVGQILKQRPVNHGKRMTMATYKAAFMAGLGHEVEMIPNIDGDGFFPMGLSTSALTVGEFSQLIEYVLAWCAREGLTVQHFDAPADEKAHAA